MKRSLNLIGDQIEVDGVVVAILAQSGVAASIMGDFVDGFNNATLFEGEDVDECECKHKRGCPMHRAEVGTQTSELDDDDRQPLLDALTKRAKNGLLRVQDACDVINNYMDGELGP